jgi:hypothetical protein
MVQLQQLGLDSVFLLFRPFPMQVATTAPQTSWGLFAVGPDMAQVLAVVAPLKASLSSV